MFLAEIVPKKRGRRYTPPDGIVTIIGMTDDLRTENDPGEPGGAARRVDMRLWLAVFLATGCLYVATAQRSLNWQDSGDYQWRILRGDRTGTMGLARAHPLYIAAGEQVIALFGDRGLAALNAFSGVGMAVALANVAALLCLLGVRPSAAALTAALLATCHTVWWLATITETYPWSLALLTAEWCFLVLLLQRPSAKWLACLAGVTGANLCVHNLALLAWPVYAIVAAVLLWRKRLGWRAVALAVPAWLLGAALLLLMTADLAMQTGDGFGAIRSMLVGTFGREVAGMGWNASFLKANAALTAMNFLNPILPLAVLGWLRLSRVAGRDIAAALGAITMIHVLFYVRYPIPDQFMFVLPSLALFAVAAGIGVEWIARRGGRWFEGTAVVMVVAIILQPIVYAAAPDLVRATVGEIRKRELPFRDEARYWLTPWKHNEESAERFARAVFEQAPYDAAVLADSTTVFPLRVGRQVWQTRDDLLVVTGGALDSAPDALARPMVVVNDGTWDNRRTLHLWGQEFYVEPPAPGQVVLRLR
jgi:hypothetical protein